MADATLEHDLEHEVRDLQNRLRHLNEARTAAKDEKALLAGVGGLWARLTGTHDERMEGVEVRLSETEAELQVVRDALKTAREALAEIRSGLRRQRDADEQAARTALDTEPVPDDPALRERQRTAIEASCREIRGLIDVVERGIEAAEEYSTETIRASMMGRKAYMYGSTGAISAQLEHAHLRIEEKQNALREALSTTGLPGLEGGLSTPPFIQVSLQHTIVADSTEQRAKWLEMNGQLTILEEVLRIRQKRLEEKAPDR